MSVNGRIHADAVVDAEVFTRFVKHGYGVARIGVEVNPHVGELRSQGLHHTRHIEVRAECSTSAVNPSSPAETTPMDSNYLNDDPAVAWDGTADEIAQMVQDARPFELRAQQFWDTLPTDPESTPNSGSTATSTQESKP